MAKTRDWDFWKEMAARLLKERTGEDVKSWNRRIKKERLSDEKSLRTWLAKQGVTGYARTLLIMEQFGYPDFLVTPADKLIDGQYADRPQLRPIYEAIVKAVSKLGDFVVQARKGYVSLVTPRRTFARVQPTTRTRVDLGLRLEGEKPVGRLKPSRIHESMKLQIGLTSVKEVDAEVIAWLERAYKENC